MTKSKIFNVSKDKIISGLNKMLDDKKVSKLGELTNIENGYSFKYSQFGTTTVTLCCNEIDSQTTEVTANFDIASTHKFVLTDETINSNFEKYSTVLVETYCR